MMAPYECYKQGTLHNLFVLLNNSYTNWITLARLNTVTLSNKGKVPDHSVGVLLFAPQVFKENLHGCHSYSTLFHLKRTQVGQEVDHFTYIS